MTHGSKHGNKPQTAAAQLWTCLFKGYAEQQQKQQVQLLLQRKEEMQERTETDTWEHNTAQLPSRSVTLHCPTESVCINKSKEMNRREVRKRSKAKAKRGASWMFGGLDYMTYMRLLPWDNIWWYDCALCVLALKRCSYQSAHSVECPEVPGNTDFLFLLEFPQWHSLRVDAYSTHKVSLCLQHKQLLLLLLLRALYSFTRGESSPTAGNPPQTRFL